MFKIDLISDRFTDPSKASLASKESQADRITIRDAVVDAINRANAAIDTNKGAVNSNISSINNLIEELNILKFELGEETSTLDATLTKVLNKLRTDFSDLENIVANSVTQDDIDNAVDALAEKIAANDDDDLSQSQKIAKLYLRVQALEAKVNKKKSNFILRFFRWVAGLFD